MLLLPELYEPGSVELDGWVGLSGVSRMRCKGLHLRLTLRNLPNVIGREICPSLRSSAQPMYFQTIDLGRRTQTYMHPMAVLRQVRGTAHCSAYRDFARPRDDRCTVAESQRGSSWGNTAVQPELGPIALRDVVAQKAHTFALI